LRWIGDVRDSAFAPQTVVSVLGEANGFQEDRARWVSCGAPAYKRCSVTEFPAVVALSEPWIDGDGAQVLVYVWYRSTIDAHPHAWFASVAHLQLVDGEWTATKWNNLAGT